MVKKIIGISCILTVVPVLYGTAFTIKFEGSNAVTVHINNKDYKLGGTTKTTWVDTGLDDLETIGWTESNVTKKSGGDFDVTEYEYAVTLKKTPNVLNVGGWFAIGDNGKYRYYFGDDGRQEYTYARRISPGKKVF